MEKGKLSLSADVEKWQITERLAAVVSIFLSSQIWKMLWMTLRYKREEQIGGEDFALWRSKYVQEQEI